MGNTIYIVDYDLPETPASNRVQFYRDLKKLPNKICSTQSVFCTEDIHIAHAVYLLVVAHKGSGHIYQGKDITPYIQDTVTSFSTNSTNPE
ncbi:MAG: hypothetical protein PVF58_09605 [Candidatus Methanofastidiosia archaeon]|jgi:hypothetical protein